MVRRPLKGGSRQVRLRNFPIPVRVSTKELREYSVMGKSLGKKRGGIHKSRQKPFAHVPVTSRQRVGWRSAERKNFFHKKKEGEGEEEGEDFYIAGKVKRRCRNTRSGGPLGGSKSLRREERERSCQKNGRKAENANMREHIEALGLGQRGGFVRGGGGSSKKKNQVNGEWESEENNGARVSGNQTNRVRGRYFSIFESSR